MKAAMKALVPALALAAALSLPSVAEAGHRHGPRCGHRGYYSDGYARRHRQGHYARPLGHYGYRADPRYYGYRNGYAPAPYAYGYGNGYGYSNGYGYGYYPPPPPRPRVGVSLYFGF